MGGVSYKLQKRIDEYMKLYKKDEYLVMQITKDTFGGTVEKSTINEDKCMHVDFWWNSPKGGRIGIDVKGIRKNDDGEYDDSFAWLELKNNYGNPGWLYGKEEYIAFKTFTRIIYIKREVLAKYAESKAKGKKVVFNKPSEYYVPYQRKYWGRDDMTIKVPISDIMSLVDEEGKNNGFYAEYR